MLSLLHARILGWRWGKCLCALFLCGSFCSFFVMGKFSVFHSAISFIVACDCGQEDQEHLHQACTWSRGDARRKVWAQEAKHFCLRYERIDRGGVWVVVKPHQEKFDEQEMWRRAMSTAAQLLPFTSEHTTGGKASKFVTITIIGSAGICKSAAILSPSH